MEDLETIERNQNLIRPDQEIAEHRQTGNFGARPLLPPKHQPLDAAVSGFISLVSEPALFDPKQVSQFAAEALAADPEFDAKLVRAIQRGDFLTTDTAIRILRGLECFCPKTRLLHHLLRLKSVDGRVRSKVTLTVGRLVQNAQWLREQLEDGNARVRANAVEALWGARVPEMSQLLYQASQDSHNRVVANAAVGLHKIGDTRCISVINDLLQHKVEMFRRSGLFAAAQTRDPRYFKKIKRHLRAASLEERDFAGKALRAITDNQRTTDFLASMEIEVRQVKTQADGQCIAILSCISQSLNRWLEPADLNALDFVITEGAHQIENQALRPTPSTAALSAIIVFPVTCLASAPLFVEMWRDGREPEKIALLPYYSSESGTTHLYKEDDCRVVFDNQMSKLVEHLERGDVRIAANLEQAVLKSAQALKPLPGWRHIVVLADPSTRVEDSPKLPALLQNQGVEVHAVVASAAPAATSKALEKLSLSSGGTFTSTDSVDALRRLLLSIRVCHFGLFELSWCSQEADAASVTISCCSRVGSGTTSFTAPPVIAI